MKKVTEYTSKYVSSPDQETVKAICLSLYDEMLELIKSRHTTIYVDENVAGILNELNQKAKAIAVEANIRLIQHKKHHLSPKFFSDFLLSKHEKLYSTWKTERGKIKSNMYFRRKYPKIAVQAEGFKKIHKALKDPSGKKLEALLSGPPKRTRRRQGPSPGSGRDTMPASNFCKDNARLFYIDPEIGRSGAGASND